MGVQVDQAGRDHLAAYVAHLRGRAGYQLVADGKAKGAKGHAFGSVGVGHTGHIWSELLASEKKFQASHAAYKGSGPLVIDLTAERAGLEKEIAVFDADIGHVNKKLGNPNFVSRAAPEVVEEQRMKLAEAEAGKVKLQAALARLSEIG
jgi:hypothetical protein